MAAQVEGIGGMHCGARGGKMEAGVLRVQQQPRVFQSPKSKVGLAKVSCGF